MPRRSDYPDALRTAYRVLSCLVCATGLTLNPAPAQRLTGAVANSPSAPSQILSDALVPYTAFRPSTLVAWHPTKATLLVNMQAGLGASWQRFLVNSPGEAPVPVTTSTDTAPYYAEPALDDSDGQVLIANIEGIRRLVKHNVAPATPTVLAGHLPFPVDEFAISVRADRIAFITDEFGVSVLRFLERSTGKEMLRPALLPGKIANLRWRSSATPNDGLQDSNSAESNVKTTLSDVLAFNLSTFRSPSEVFTYDVATTKLTRWTNGAAAGINALSFVEPTRFRWQATNGASQSGYLYSPDSALFPGKRPVIVVQASPLVPAVAPGFIGHDNYYVNALGISLVYLSAHGAFVDDALLAWIARQPALDANRVYVIRYAEDAAAAMPKQRGTIGGSFRRHTFHSSNGDANAKMDFYREAESIEQLLTERRR